MTSNDEENYASPTLSRVLMSEELRSVLTSDLADAGDVSQVAESIPIVILGTVFGPNEEPMVGGLQGLMFAGPDLELEVNVPLEDAMRMVKSAPDVVDPTRVSLGFVELHMGTDVTRFQPPAGYTVAGARLEAIDPQRRMCKLLLNLRSNA